MQKMPLTFSNSQLNTEIIQDKLDACEFKQLNYFVRLNFPFTKETQSSIA